MSKILFMVGFFFCFLVSILISTIVIAADQKSQKNISGGILVQPFFGQTPEQIQKKMLEQQKADQDWLSDQQNKKTTEATTVSKAKKPTKTMESVPEELPAILPAAPAPNYYPGGQPTGQGQGGQPASKPEEDYIRGY